MDAAAAVLTALQETGLRLGRAEVEKRQPEALRAAVAAYEEAIANLERGVVSREAPPLPDPPATGLLWGRRIRLAVSGKMGTGKSTLVRALGLPPAPIAEEIKREAAEIFARAGYPWLTTAHVVANKSFCRSFLQDYAALRRALLGGRVYAERMVERTARWPAVGCDDVRERGDVAALLPAGFVLIRLNSSLDVRLRRLRALYPGITSEHLNHPSECALDDYPFEYVFDSDAPLPEVAARVAATLEPLAG